jgi:hypothetical protein
MNRKAHALIAATLTISGLMASSSASAQGFIASLAQSAGLISPQTAERLEADWHRAKQANPALAAIDHTVTQAGRTAGNAALMNSGGLPAVIGGNLVFDQWNHQVRRERELSRPAPKGHHCITPVGNYWLSHAQDVGSTCQAWTHWGPVHGQVNEHAGHFQQHWHSGPPSYR